MISTMKLAAVVFLLFALGRPLWRGRGAIRLWHLAMLAASSLLFALVATVLDDEFFLPHLVAFLAMLLGGVLLLAAATMLLARANPPAPILEPDQSHRVRRGFEDHSQSYLVPQAGALIVAFWLANTGLHIVALLVASFLAGLSWTSAQRHLRLVRNTPTSRIVSAAQGLVELHGIGHPIGELPLTSPLRRTPCIWFRYLIEEKNGKNWNTVEAATSEEPFLLDDGSGKAIVTPAGADVESCNKVTWREAERRYTEEWLLPKAKLVLIGEFVTENPVAALLDARRDACNLLVKWKTDPMALQARFDADGDGKMSLTEWQTAQKQAAREIASAHCEARALPAVHVVRKPADKRKFFIGNASEGEVEKKARRDALLRMGWFALLLGGTTYAAVRAVGEARGTRREPGAARSAL
jgi:hypothetical protein